jgi:predicted Zn-dependent protease with MMP-like domain
MMSRDFAQPPDLADIEAIARDSLKSLPQVLRSKTTDVVVQVHDFPDAATMHDLGLQTPFDLLGLYRGVPLSEKSVSDAPQTVDMVFLYRRPLLDYWCETGEDLTHLVRHVLIHEIGHHFGFSDEEMESLEARG